MRKGMIFIGTLFLLTACGPEWRTLSEVKKTNGDVLSCYRIAFREKGIDCSQSETTIFIKYLDLAEIKRPIHSSSADISK